MKTTTTCPRCGREIPFKEIGPRGRCLVCQELLAEMDRLARSAIQARSDAKRTERRRKRERRPWPRHSFVYRLYDQQGTLLYIGKTNHPYRRFFTSRTAHATTKDWWPEVIEAHLSCYVDERTAFEAERHAIKWEQPLHNKDLSGPHTQIEPEPLYTIVGSIS